LCVFEGHNDRNVSDICISASGIYETECIITDVVTDRVKAFPATLLEFQDKLRSILQDRVVHYPGIDAPGMHSAAADRAESRLQFFGDRKNFDAFGYDRSFDDQVGIFQVDQFCDIIHTSSPFITGFRFADK
jgi:hypothetical protein